ncbi:MAG: nitroreductase family protein [Armatimonadota bacterium]
MNCLDLILKRHSVRSFQTRNIEQEKLDIILHAIDSAPSAGNLQGYEVVLVQNSDTKGLLAKASYGQEFITQAPIVLVFCADHLLSASKYGKRGAELYSIQDATIAAAYCQLTATSLALATVWVGAFDPDVVSKAINTPDKITPVAIIPIGYPGEEPKSQSRREINDLVRRESF